MANVRLGAKAVGSTVKIKVNGTVKDFIIIHQGKPSSVYDDSCNGTWLLMKDIYEKRQWNSSNTNDYANSTIHSYLNSTFLNLLESNIKTAIKQVKSRTAKAAARPRPLPAARTACLRRFSCSVRPKRVSTTSICRAVKAQSWPISRVVRTMVQILSVSQISAAGPTSGGSALRAAAATPPTSCTSAPMAAWTTTAAPAGTASAPLLYCPLLFWCLTMARSRLTPRPRLRGTFPFLRPS